MKIHREFKIKTFQKLLELSAQIKEKNEWSRSIELENTINDSEHSGLCFVSTKLKHRSNAFIYVANDSNTGKVANIVPRNGEDLSIEEYNAILMDWHRCYLVGLDLQFEIGPDDEILMEAIGTLAYSFFQRFANTANKSTGISHPIDQERWFEFVYACASTKKYPNSELIKEQLIKYSWSPKIAESVANEFNSTYDAMAYTINRAGIEA